MFLRSRWTIALALIVLGCRPRAEPAAQGSAGTAIAPPSVAAAPDTTALPADTVGVLFAVDVPASAQGTVTLTAMAYLRDTTLAQPPVGETGDSAADAFRALWYASPLHYRFFSNGVEVGTLTAPHPEEPGCAGLDASAAWAPGPNGATLRHGIATNLRRLHTGPPLFRPVPAGDSAALVGFVRKLLADSGVTFGPKVALQIKSLVSVGIDGPEAVASFGAFEVDQATTPAGPGGDDAAEMQYSVVVVTEHDASGDHPRALLYNKGAEADVAFWTVFDALDLFGDRTPEVILQGSYYESNNYLIYRRTSAGWRKIYEGGGGGC